MNEVFKVKQLVSEINTIQEIFVKDYFETGKVIKLNLENSLENIPIKEIHKYRLNLHEAINDYLMVADVSGINFFYRVKTSEAILDKLMSVVSGANEQSVNTILKDIFGARMILSNQAISEVLTDLDSWKDHHKLFDWELVDTEDYSGLHLYFKNEECFYYPWELQLWDKKDITRNIEGHQKPKLEKLKRMGEYLL